jgi:hypothetical protein
MKNTPARLISTLMIAAALLGFAAVIPVHADVWGNTNPRVFVDAASNVFTGLSVGQTFSVNVTIANCSGIGGYQFTLSWNPTLLFAVSVTEVFLNDPAITPPAESGNINLVQHAINNTGGYISYAGTYLSMDEAKTYTPPYAPINITMANWAEGKHAIVTVVLRVQQAATKVPGYVSCALSLSNVIVGDINAIPITITTVDGTYRNNWAAPTALPYFSVSPATYTAHSLGEIFNISVLVNNMDAAWEAVGFEFKLGYNSTILSIVQVYEGPWLPPFGGAPNQGTTFLKNFGTDYVQIGDLVEPDVNGSWHPPFPYAGVPGGVMAIIQYNATQIGTFPVTLSCPLHLYDTIVADWHATVLNQSAPVDGFYSIVPAVVGRSIDIYTEWPEPFGGQGLNQPSDMFWPQKEVCLFANVTYNKYPEQQKDVAFQVIDPHGVTWAVIYGRSDLNGVAKACFRLPWPCANPEYWFGVWTVVGTVDIACVIVNDTLTFHYDYLIDIFKVTLDKPSYNHGDTVTLNVTYGTHLQQTSVTYVDPDTSATVTITNVTVAVTALDEVHVPFGFQYAQIPLPGTVYCTYGNVTVTLSVTIPKFAVAGTGEIDTAVLNNWPYILGGTVISGYYDPVLGWLPYAPTPIIINAA